MSPASAQRIWCRTCATYVRPGNHGIHEIRYGMGPSEGYPYDEPTHAFSTVLLMIAGMVGLASALLLVALWAGRVAH